MPRDQGLDSPPPAKPALLDRFSEMATDAGITRLRLMPDPEPNNLKARTRFFERYGFTPCPNRPKNQCKDLTTEETA